MLQVKNLHVSVDGAPILNGLNLHVKTGEVHAIMGPNGSGKSTLSKVIAGHKDYVVTAGDIHYNDKPLLDLEPEVRAQQGIFLGFQYPVEIPGVSNIQFLKTAVNAIGRVNGKEALDAMDFLETVKKTCKQLQLDESFLYRAVNEGFSGGEKKRNEILQMLLLKPTLALLDETDSGLDIDALKIVAEGINSLHSSERSIVLVTHYQRLLDFIKPDFIHVLAQGKIVRTGDASLAHELEEKGYGWIESN